MISNHMFPYSDMHTGTALLDGLHDQSNSEAWGEMVARYRPLIVGFAGRAGLSDADAEDLAQIVLMEAARAYVGGSYDRGKGRLRQWLFGIAKRQLANGKRRRGLERTRDRDTRTTAFFDRIPTPAELDAAWQAQWDAHVIHRCIERVSAEVTPQTMEAFHLFAIAGLPAGEVARELGITENAVFGAKRRVLTRVRELAAEIEAGE